MQGSPDKQRQSIQDVLQKLMLLSSPIESINTLRELNFQLSYFDDDSFNKDEILLALLESNVY